MHKTILRSLLISSLCCIISCEQNAEQTNTAEKPPIQTAKAKEQTENNVIFEADTLLNRNATLLAALDNTAITDSSTLKAFNKLNRIWDYKTKKTLLPIAQWIKEEKYDITNKSTLVFYPFSGPDFEFAAAFYPEADEYVLCGLEPAGNDSALIFSRQLTVDSFLTKAENYFFYSSRFGFFRTLDMEQQFKKRGVIDIIAFYLKRAGAQIGKVETYHWENGVFAKADTSKQSNVVHFDFQFPSGKVSSLYYFSKDLSNAGLTADSMWLAWVKNRANNKQLVSLTKSASYLMHTPYFSMVRNFILENSVLHIQDDSGIDYGHMKKTGRPVKLYGTYSRVIPLFKNKFQLDLKEAYTTDSSMRKTMPFQIGYNLKVGEANLQVMQ